MALRYEINLQTGITFSLALRTAQPESVSYADISAITQSAPAALTTTNPHGLLNGWPVWVESCKGMVEINNPRPDDCHNNTVCPPYIADTTDTNTLTLRGVNARGFGAYRGSGVLAWQTPWDVTGFIGRFTVVDDDSGLQLFDLASNVADPDGLITIDGANATVALRIEATATVVPATTQSASYTFTLTDPSDDNRVYLLAQGPIKVS